MVELRIVKKAKLFFLKKDTGKDTVDLKRIFLGLGCLLGIGATLVMIFKSKPDSSVIIQTSTPINAAEGTPVPQRESNKVSGMLTASAKNMREQSGMRQRETEPQHVTRIEYKAPQVIQRKDRGRLEQSLPLGTNLVGKLLTAIDTREKDQFYKVLLPYGGSDKNGGNIPKNSILFGKINYSGNGEKVFIQFSKALLPDGKEVQLKAQALSAKDYSPGLVGDFHGKRTERIASTLGLTMVSAMTETLTERQTIGHGEAVAPKATTRNALYQGISKVSEMEAARQASELGNQQEYLTVPAGKEMIVNLISTYNGEK